MQPPEDRSPVVILGAGIVGICTALSLLERGVPVTLIDKGEPGQETSMGNAGVVSPWSIIPQSMPGTWKAIPKLMFGYGKPLSIHPKSVLKMLPWGLRFLGRGREEVVRETALAMSQLCGPSIDLYEKHLRGTGQEGLITESYYVHAFRDASKARLNSLDYRIRSELGAETELIGKDQLQRTEPAISRAFNAAVLIKGQARIRSPGKLGQVLAQKARDLGAEFKKAEVKSVERAEEHWTVICEGEILSAQRLVICMGAWSPQFLKFTGLKIPLMAERGYHVEFAAPGIELNNSVMDVDAKVVASSMEGGLRVAGQAEFAPVDAPPKQKQKQNLTRIAKSAFPDLQTSNVSFWMGRRPSFPDSLPMMGSVSGQPGVFVNFGHSHYGLMMAPKSGETLANVLCDTAVNENLSAFSAARFS